MIKMKLALFALVAVLCATLVSGCSNTPYKNEVSPVYYANNLTATELALHEGNMQKVIDYYLNGPTGAKSFFSALIVDAVTNEEICYGYNQGGKSMIYHGEIQAIMNCTTITGRNSWSGTYLYTTGESCPMCQAAIMWSGFDKVIYGSSIKTLYCENCMTQIALDSNVVNGQGFGLVQANNQTAWKPVQIIGGILSNITDTKVFRNYCNSTTSIFKATPYCNADFVGYNNTCAGTNSTCPPCENNATCPPCENAASFNANTMSFVLISFLAAIVIFA
ncbi:CMP/dCMP deaminase [Cavenderia fasciculata]|uniref:CMP/dCMP deaminase n=1 Tax=Cavenderia fasciculata TaxID=261658 RepID=F4PTM3_CACFS|nr:CMP/dCMP deaminase [Cavenderia fasciculata]EGG21693.1 CMP/dCMP deaminase [Cavenderia fasciculata]|eukprot:XP_004359543.1 CMP/dCMP deaminase [Cavenderia fasciculata]